jgi:hypothetical protein
MDLDAGDWEEEDLPDEEEDYFTVPCPSCGAQIHEDSPCCPICGDYITSSSGTVWQGKPGWYVGLAILGIIALILALLVGF